MDDPDETEGRNLYRQRAETLARAQLRIGGRQVRLDFCQAIKLEGGEMVCHYCGSQWHPAMMGLAWWPLSCAKRRDPADKEH